MPLSPRVARHFPPCSGEANDQGRKKFIVLLFIYAFYDNLCRILTAPVGRGWRLIAFSRRSAPKNTIRLPSLLITTAQEWRHEWIAFRYGVNWLLAKKKRTQTVSLPRLSGKVSAKLTEGASVSRTGKRVSYGATLNTCLSFLNEVKNLGRDCKI